MIKKMNVFAVVLMLTGLAFSQNSGTPVRGIPHHGPRQNHPISTLLTEDQQAELSALIEELRANDASREEIQTAVGKLLESWGIELPESRDRRFVRSPGFRPDSVLAGLSEDQRTEIRELVSSLRENEATIEEINFAVIELLTAWGVDLPEDWRFPLRMRGRRRAPLGSGLQLTEEQRQIIRGTVMEMRDAGASREEIRAAVRALLDEFGVTPPDDGDNSESPSIETRETFGLQNHPNPFNPDTHIFFTLPNPEHVTLSIYNLQGQLVRILVDDYKDAGNYSIYWDGLDRYGQQAVSGIYIYQITAGNKSAGSQMILMK